MCGCEHHRDHNAPCTCTCPDHKAVRAEMSRTAPMSATDHTLTDAKAERKAEPMAEPMFGMPIGPWFRWFAWHPVCTTDRGWRWLRPVWRRRYQTKPHLSGPVMRWFNESVTDPRGATR